MAEREQMTQPDEGWDRKGEARSLKGWSTSQLGMVEVVDLGHIPFGRAARERRQATRALEEH